MTDGYPRVYRRRAGSRYLTAGFGALLAAAGLLAAGWMTLASPDEGEWFGLMVLCLVISACGACFLAYALRTRIVLHADAIEIHRTITSKTLARASLRGRRHLSTFLGGRGIESQELFMVNELRGIRLPYGLESDHDLESWIAAIPDLDHMEREASLATVLADPQLQGTRQEKLAQLNSARRDAQRLTWACLAVCAWVWFYPQPYDLAMLGVASLPWVAVALARRGGALYRLNPGRNHVTADITLPLLLPALLLALRALVDTELLDSDRMLSWTLGGALAGILLVCMLVAEVRKQPGTLFVVIIVMLIYSFGLMTYVDRDFDRHSPVSYAAQVLDRRMSTGKSTTYYLTLGAWGPRTDAQEVHVPEELYYRLNKGDSTCVTLWPGALGVRYYVVGACGAH